jgi:hypothetical protein
MPASGTGSVSVQGSAVLKIPGLPPLSDLRLRGNGLLALPAIITGLEDARLGLSGRGNAFAARDVEKQSVTEGTGKAVLVQAGPEPTSPAPVTSGSPSHGD